MTDTRAVRPAETEVRWGTNGYGLRSGGRFYLIHCGDCGRENWAMEIVRGECCWCGSVGPVPEPEGGGNG